MKVYTKTCLICEKEFDTTNNRNLTCSKECRRIYQSNKKKENWKDPQYRSNQSKRIKEGQNNPITKEKLSKAHKGKSSWNKGIPRTEEQKKHMSIIMKSKPSNRKGTRLSEELKDKISKATKEGMKNPEIRHKISLKRTGKKASDTTKAKLKQRLDSRTAEQVKDYVNKCINTKKLHNSFNKSNSEDEIFKLLITIYPNTVRQYKSNVYPFACDFYVPEKDLYIEYQEMWTHGKEPYNENNEEHKEIINRWKSKNTKFYNKAIEVWTISDPLKRKTAKDNKLNWIEFFNIKEFENWFNILVIQERITK